MLITSFRHRLACGAALGVLLGAPAVQAQAPVIPAAQPAPATPSEPEPSVDALPPASEDASEAATTPEEATEVEAVVVVGSQIRGARVNTALPVRVIDEAEIVATGAVSGDELFRSIPQMGDVLFSAANNPQTSNAARGDVNSINLRSLGVGNTLVLLNGRRLVQHAASQGTSDTGLVPVLTFNANSIPVSGVERLEVLLDGAAAIYGADAVAGVVNTVLQSDYDGARVELQYGGAEGTHRREFTGNLLLGRNFQRGNLTLFVNVTDRTSQRAEDEAYTASADLRPLFADDPVYGGLLGTDGRATRGPYASLQTVGNAAPVRQGHGRADHRRGRLPHPADDPGRLRRGDRDGRVHRLGCASHDRRGAHPALRHGGRHHGQPGGGAGQRLPDRPLRPHRHGRGLRRARLLPG